MKSDYREIDIETAYREAKLTGAEWAWDQVHAYAVSYTHLDVYKRQVQGFSATASRTCRSAYPTYEDVYKRQVWGRPRRR